MNQYSKEIQADLTKLAEKYKIKHGMLLFQEEDAKDSTKENSRVIVFQPNKDFNLCDYARMFLSCLNVSKTLQNIMEHVSEHSMQELIKHVVIDHRLKNPDNTTKN